MTKEFITYEQSLELKELGFDEPCLSYYDKEEKLCRSLLEYPIINSKNGFHQSHNIITAPLYQQAFRWFREKYNIDSWIQPFTFEKSNGDLYLPDESYSYFIFKDGVLVDDEVDFLEPEEAELACLKKLIEIVKNNINE
jgi:hypothetical protein